MSRWILAALLALPLSIAACGDDTNSDAESTGTTENGDAESGSSDELSSAEGDGSGSSLASLQRELNEIILGIESTDDVKAAEGDIDAVFDRMAEVIRDSDVSSESMDVQFDPEYSKLQDKMNDHIQKIAQDDPQVMLALSKVLARNSSKVLEAAGERLGSTEEGLLKGAQKLLEEGAEEGDDASK